jgi:hypothetical protein
MVQMGDRNENWEEDETGRREIGDVKGKRV